MSSLDRKTLNLAQLGRVAIKEDPLQSEHLISPDLTQSNDHECFSLLSPGGVQPGQCGLEQPILPSRRLSFHYYRG